MFLDGDKYFEIAECAAFWIFSPAKVPFGMDSINVSGCLKLINPLLPIRDIEIVKRPQIETFYPASADEHTGVTVAATGALM